MPFHYNCVIMFPVLSVLRVGVWNALTGSGVNGIGLQLILDLQEIFYQC